MKYTPNKISDALSIQIDSMLYTRAPLISKFFWRIQNTLLLSLLGICIFLLSTVVASARDARNFTPKSRPAAPAPLVVPPNPNRPAEQAQAIGLGQCAPILAQMGSQTLTQTYDLQSGWSRTDPNHHVFQSVAAMTNPSNVPPDGVTALVAAPVTGGGCDGVAIQVFPLAADCPTAQKVMLKKGHLLAAMLNTRIMLDTHGNRVILLPGHANTCIAISVDSHFGTP